MPRALPILGLALIGCAPGGGLAEREPGLHVHLALVPDGDAWVIRLDNESDQRLGLGCGPLGQSSPWAGSCKDELGVQAQQADGRWFRRWFVVGATFVDERRVVLPGGSAELGRVRAPHPGLFRILLRAEELGAQALVHEFAVAGWGRDATDATLTLSREARRTGCESWEAALVRELSCRLEPDSLLDAHDNYSAWRTRTRSEMLVRGNFNEFLESEVPRLPIGEVMSTLRATPIRLMQPNVQRLFAARLAEHIARPQAWEPDDDLIVAELAPLWPPATREAFFQQLERGPNSTHFGAMLGIAAYEAWGQLGREPARLLRIVQRHCDGEGDQVAAECALIRIRLGGGGMGRGHGHAYPLCGFFPARDGCEPFARGWDDLLAIYGPLTLVPLGAYSVSIPMN